MTSSDYLEDLIQTVSIPGVSLDAPYYFLGGPMSGYPRFNFAEFDTAAFRLRGSGYNVACPYELCSRETRMAAFASSNGMPDPSLPWAACLERDLILCSLPTCRGGIFLPGWTKSEGAKAETYVLSRLKKAVFEYHTATDGSPTLTLIDRDSQLRWEEAL